MDQALHHRRDLGGGAALELAIDTEAAPLDVPVDHDARRGTGRATRSWGSIRVWLLHDDAPPGMRRSVGLAE